MHDLERLLMAMTREYAENEPSLEEVCSLPGATLLEFGAPWCGHCARMQPALAEAFAGRDDVRHLKIEDGRGRPLGRSYGVKLWPTLIFLRDGRELARLVRPRASADIVTAFRQQETG